MSTSLKEGWNAISTYYQRKMRIPTDDVYWGEFVPSESKLRILGEVEGKRILEIGCGGAQNAIALAKWGAEAYGIDLSRQQILHAKKLAMRDKVPVNLVVGDMQRLPFKDETFDTVTTAISLHYVPDLKGAVTEINRVLPRNGCFTFSAEHPLSVGKLVRMRGRNAVVVRGYFKRRTIRWVSRLRDGSKIGMQAYYRTLQDYFDALLQNGFKIERYVELERLERKALHSLDLDDIKRRQDARQLYEIMKEIPYWFIIKARKG